MATTKGTRGRKAGSARKATRKGGSAPAPKPPVSSADAVLDELRATASDHSEQPFTKARAVKRMRDRNVAAARVKPETESTLYFARRTLDYGPAGTAGKHLTQGQAFRMGVDASADEQLVRLRYVEPYNKREHGELRTCRACPERFKDENALRIHGQAAHEPKQNPALERLAARAQEVKHDWSRMTKTEQDAATAELDQLSEAAGQYEDQRTEREIAHANATAPLALDRTAATLRG